MEALEGEFNVILKYNMHVYHLTWSLTTSIWSTIRFLSSDSCKEKDVNGNGNGSGLKEWDWER